MDLGLPSGLLWATKNLGASTPGQYGYYFSWANTEGHVKDSGYDFSQVVYNETPGAEASGSMTPSNDPATIELGQAWHTPSRSEIEELIQNCTAQYMQFDGSYGILFTSRINGKRLFIPAAGSYNGTELRSESLHGLLWSSSYSSMSVSPILYFNENANVVMDFMERYGGCNIRPVRLPD